MRSGILGACLAALVLSGAAARADIADFIGNWHNPARDLSGMTHVVISPGGGGSVYVRVYGDCHAVECSWGLVSGKTYTTDPRSAEVDRITAAIDFGFAHREIVFRKGPGGKLAFEMLTDFSDGSGRHNFVSNGTLEPSAWAGPVTQNWERPVALRTGWGGGADGGASMPPAEKCTGFDPKAVHHVAEGGRWKVMAGGEPLLDAGRDEHNAISAETVLRFYRFDRKCSIGWGPYWKRGDSFPSQKMGGANCVIFNPTTVHVAPVGHVWKLVAGNDTLAEAADKRLADAVFALIRQHRLDMECFVRRPDPVMVYWLSHG